MNWISICNDVIPKSGLWNVCIQKTFQVAYYSTKIDFIGSILHWKRNRKNFLCVIWGHKWEWQWQELCFPLGFIPLETQWWWLSINSDNLKVNYLPHIWVCQNRIPLCIYLQKFEVLAVFFFFNVARNNATLMTS